jgi:hypothetical protein
MNWEIKGGSDLWDDLDRYLDDQISTMHSQPERVGEAEDLYALMDKAEEAQQGTLDISTLPHENIEIADGEDRDIYILAVGPWCIYYELDFPTKSALCLGAHHLDDGLRRNRHC